MEVTPKVFRDVQFREKLRGGYHHEDVDEFLEQAAAGVEVLVDQLHQATERAQRAEQAASEATATDDALKRMLLMAQRTADQAVHEAREQADALVADARSQADRILADAEQRGSQAYESALAEGRANMEKCDEELRQAQQEVEALKGWVTLHKAHLLGVLHDAEALVEKAGLLSEPPAVSSRAQLVSGELFHDDEFMPVNPEAVANSEDPGQVPADPLPTGEWDPGDLSGLHDPDQPGQEQYAQSEQMLHDQATEAVPAAQQSTGQVPEEGAGAAEVARHAGPSDDATLSIDERALDSFFSDQELGDDRGPGRFHRR